MEEDGFQLVSRKKSARAPPRLLRSQLQDDYGGAGSAEILTRINSLK